MLPDLRFAIGAVLASALLIVAAFGLAATVRVAHHQSATPDDPWHTLSFNDPTDWGLLAERSRPTTTAKTEPPDVPLRDLAAATPDPAFTGTIDPAKSSAKRVPGEAVETGEPRATLDTPAAAKAPEPTPDPDVVAAIPPTAPVQAPETPSIATPRVLPNVAPPGIEDGPLEPSERVGALPGFPTAGPGFVPPEHPIALPGLEPSGKTVVKSTPKKKTVRRRARHRLVAPAPFANSGYPLGGFADTKFSDPKFPDPRFPAIGSGKKWTAE
jgi:hypothetical protein